MCGIAGVLNLTVQKPVETAALQRMLAMIRHRGPDSAGVYRDGHIGLGSTRLSIIDIAGGQQPIANEDGTLWIVYNGEVFNYPELRQELEVRGHRFSTNTDTEVIVHLFEECGPDCLDQLNGQFAFALWDTKNCSLFLARDRVGIRPLFYTLHDGQLVFGSEIKAILAYPGIAAEIDPVSVEQVFTFWSTLSPRTAFRNIWELPAGHFMLVEEGYQTIRQYWALDFHEDNKGCKPTQAYLDEFRQLLIDATLVRLRADVPVGAYLSGGLDSSVMTAIVHGYSHNRLDTFSIAFDDPQFDESAFQRQMAGYLETNHHVLRCSPSDIGIAFRDVIWHAETPILRTAPAPLFLLSKRVRDCGLKVVLTGEGADECLAGYNIFREAKVRRFWAKRPESQLRPLLLNRLYPYIANLGSGGNAYLRSFFGRGLTDTSSPFYSHMIRWQNGARIARFLAGPARPKSAGHESYSEQVRLPPTFNTWSPLGQAQYLEMSIFLSRYLLSSQGDRMAMSHSVEGRFPFLDHRVVEFCGRLPGNLKLRRLNEKWLLKQLGQDLVPEGIWSRSKRPYRAPIRRCFFGENAPDYVPELLSDSAIRACGLFNPAAIAQLVRKARSDVLLTEVDEMALAGILSTQLLTHQMVKSLRNPGLGDAQDWKIVDQVSDQQPVASSALEEQM